MAQPHRLDTAGMALEMLANGTHSGEKSLLGSMNMDAFLQDVWDKDPSLQDTIGSLNTSFQMPDAGGGETTTRRTSNRALMELLARSQQQHGAPGQQPAAGSAAVSLWPPPREGHHVIASTGFAIPADYSGRTVDEVWSRIADAEAPYDNLQLGHFLERIGVRSVEEGHPPQQGFGATSGTGAPLSQPPPQHLPLISHQQGQELPYAGHISPANANGGVQAAGGGGGALYGAPQPHLDRQLEAELQRQQAELQRQQQEQAALQRHLVSIQQGAGGMSAPLPLDFLLPAEQPLQQQYNNGFGAPAQLRGDDGLYSASMQPPQFQASASGQLMGPPPPRAGPPPLQGIPIAQPLDDSGDLDGGGGTPGLHYSDRDAYGGSGGGGGVRAEAARQTSGSLDRSPAPEGSPVSDGQAMPEIPAAARGGAAKPPPPSAAATAAARAARQRKRKDAPGSPEPDGSKTELRMVKNRESAARSRLRKQAYTSELEAQVEQLRRQNAELRERVVRACPALDAAAAPGRGPAADKPLRRTRTDPT